MSSVTSLNTKPDNVSSHASKRGLHDRYSAGSDTRFLSPSFWGIEPISAQDFFKERSDDHILPNLPDAALKFKQRYLHVKFLNCFVLAQIIKFPFYHVDGCRQNQPNWTESFGQGGLFDKRNSSRQKAMVQI
jgi:hypothetical protein